MDAVYNILYSKCGFIKRLISFKWTSSQNFQQESKTMIIRRCVINDKELNFSLSLSGLKK